MSKRNRSTSIYRQVDPSINTNRGSNPKATITAVTTDPLDTHNLIFYFDQPIWTQTAPVTPPEWDYQGAAFSAFGTLSADGQSLVVIFDGNLTPGDTINTTTGWDGVPYYGLLNSTIQGSINTVVSFTTQPIVELQQAQRTAANTYTLTFSEGVALCPAFAFTHTSASVLMGAQHITTATPLDNGGSTWRVTTGVDVPAGAVWTAAAGVDSFVGLSGKPLGDGNGTIL